MRPQYYALLADSLVLTAAGEEGLRVLDEALTMTEATGERCYQAELYRLKGERLAREKGRDAAQAAEHCFEQALAVARRQQARSLELRAAMSLAQLYRDRGQDDAARDLVTPIYQQFTEGFDTLDLRDAKALVESTGRRMRG